MSLSTATDTSPRPPSPLQADPATVTFPATDSENSLHSFRQRYLRAFDSELTFGDFEMLTTQFSAEAVELAQDITSQRRPKPAPRRPDRPSARPTIDHRRSSTDDPAAARRLQTLYRLSKKRAARKIFGDESPGFDGTLDDATTFFTEPSGPGTVTSSNYKINCRNTSPPWLRTIHSSCHQLLKNSCRNYAPSSTLHLAKIAWNIATSASSIQNAKSCRTCSPIALKTKTSLPTRSQQPRS